MKLWQAGVVVVASAGNYGPKAQTISVPGNTPYVITVGAMTDNYTPNDPTDDGVASFSSAGPTYEGFVKPDVDRSRRAPRRNHVHLSSEPDATTCSSRAMRSARTSCPGPPRPPP